MSPELIQAIKERLAAGQTKDEIETAVLSMGHSKEVFEAAFTLAEHDLKNKDEDEIELPKARTLFKNAWKFIESRLDLVALLFIPLALETIGSFWFDKLPESERFVSAPLFILFLITGIAYIVTIAMALRIVSAKTTAEQTLSAAAAWMTKNVLPLLWLYVLSGLVIFGGFLFFIIPGIIVAISITFAQYIFIGEGERGMDALVGSHALVKGRWFKVVRKLFGFVVLTLIPLFLFGFAYGIITLFTGHGEYITLGGELLTQAISAVMSVMSLHAMYHLYRALNETKTEEVNSIQKYVRTRYWGLMGVSLLFSLAVVVLATFFSDKMEWLEEAASPIEEMETRDVPTEFGGFSEAALQYADENEGSYLGVCEDLRPLAEAAGEVVCNDSETAWAVQTTDAFGTSFCADSTTPGKAVPSPIGTETRCISVVE
jgi:hypothetical protein